MSSDPETRAVASTPNRRARSRRRLRDLPRKKRILFIAILAAFPLFVLGFIEGTLRLAGFGGYPPTFVEAGTLDDGSTLVFSSELGPASYFFSGRSQGLAMDPSPLVMPKPEGTFRVMWVGGSAAKGIPQPRPLRAASFFREMLGDAWPDKHVEVVNLATPGIASYPVLGVMTEALDYEPDLVVAYLGNNEFFGAFGVASLHTAGRSPAIIRLTRATRGTAIAQAMERVLVGRHTVDARSLMEAMVNDARIAPDDPLRDDAARNLETFVGDMIDRCLDRGVPIIVCPPVANEAGMFPLAEPDLSMLTEADREAVNVHLAAVRATADQAVREQEARAALAIAPHHATAHHLLGRALRAQGRADEANDAFHRAVDLDPMPWRPPTESVDAVRRAADSRGVPVADLHEAFHDASDDGCFGWDLVSDHVHPSLRGQALVARTVLGAMTRLAGDQRVSPESIAALPGWESYADRLGRNEYARFAVAHSMTLLGSIGFFHDTNPNMTSRYKDICRHILAAEPPAIRRTTLAWTDPKKNLVDRFPITGMIAETLYGLGRPADAEPQFHFAAECSDRYGSRRVAFLYYELLMRRMARGVLDVPSIRRARAAISEGRFLFRDGPTDSGRAERYVGQLHQLLGENAEAIPLLEHAAACTDPSLKPVVDRALVEAYLATGRADAARRVIEMGLAGPQAPAYRDMPGTVGP
ncbi:MAG: tetratricopeptide repeat protein [Phycisphaeraceae bacterium]|nr:MAG: tetratricopeptide repeat protein [Phycisphaeraceae bacterium]